MDKLRKIGVWAWEIKERVVLAVMVLLLGIRVYSLVNADDSFDSVKLQNPRAPVVNDSPPPPIPETPLPEPVIRLVRRSPIVYEPPSSRPGQQSSENSEDDKVRVLRIIEATGGVYRAQITTGGAAKTMVEGQSFESYQLQSIDPETGCCIIYSENSNSEIERCVDLN